MRNKALYSKYLHGRHWDFHPLEHAQHFARFLRERNFSGLLYDLGCGSGRDTNFFAEQGFDVRGVDCSSDEIAAARLRYSQSRFYVQSMECMGAKNWSVGACYCVNVFHYVRDLRRAFGEIFRVLQPGGWCFFHFNLLITDQNGTVDLQESEENIRQLLVNFQCLDSRILERVDQIPFPHKHTILQLILQKPPLE